MEGSAQPEYHDSGMAAMLSSISRCAMAAEWGEPVEVLNITTLSGPSPDMIS